MSTSQLYSRLMPQKANTIDDQSINRAMDNREITPLSQRYFSQNNIKIILKGLVDGIKKETGLTIGADAQYTELLKIMRNIFNRFWHNDYKNIPKQILELNRMTIKEAIKWTLPDLLMHNKFQSEVLQNPVNPFSLPILLSQRGNKLNGQGSSDALGL